MWVVRAEGMFLGTGCQLLSVSNKDNNRVSLSGCWMWQNIFIPFGNAGGDLELSLHFVEMPTERSQVTCLKITQYFGKYSPTTWGEPQDLDQISETMGNSKSQAYDVFPSTSIAIKKLSYESATI